MKETITCAVEGEVAIIMLPESFEGNKDRKMLETAVTAFLQKKFCGVAVDFEKTQYIDSSAIGAMIMVTNKARKQELPFALCAIKKDMAEMIAPNLGILFQTFPTKAAAIEALANGEVESIAA
ncbi:MAG: STAS domain-containing protein [SAR324 cluster bacterium]|nr:STAS domain-containing protein [SAR324 cluster bacterium]